MALYKGKKQKGDQTKGVYEEDYRTRRGPRIIGTVIFAAVLIALFLIGFFVIEPLLEKYYNENRATESEDPAASFASEPNVVDVDGLFSE